MSILIKSGEEYYEVPADVLDQCKISKEQFDEGRVKVSSEVATRSYVPRSGRDCNLVDLSVGPE